MRDEGRICEHSDSIKKCSSVRAKERAGEVRLLQEGAPTLALQCSGRQAPSKMKAAVAGWISVWHDRRTREEA